jgi:signal transduction histidine kinase
MKFLLSARSVLKSVIFVLMIVFENHVLQAQNSEAGDFVTAADTIDVQDTIYVSEFCRELENTIITAGDSAVKAEACRVAGIIYGKTGDFDRAFEMFQRSVGTASTLPPPQGNILKARALMNFAMLNHRNGDFGMALEEYLEAEKLFYLENDIPGLIYVYSGLGDLYDKILQPEKRKEINAKAFGLVDQTVDTTAIIKATTAMATNFCNDGNYKEALELYNKAVSLSQMTGNRQLEHVAWYDLGFAYSRMDDYAKAGEMYARSYEVALTTGNRMDIGDALYKMGLMSYYSEDFKKAEEQLFRAMEIAHGIQSKILERNVYDVLYSLEESRGNYRKAYEYLNSYIDVEYTIFSENDQRQANFLKAKFDAEKREFMISKLESEKNIQKLKLNKQRWLIFGLISVLLFTGTLVMSVLKRYRYRQSLAEKQKQLQEQQISELKKERQLIAAKSVLQGEERERSRIATDLHDGLGGLLSGVKINLSNLKEKSFLESDQVQAFGDVISLLDSSITELKRIAHNMVPETLHNYGLKTAVNDYCLGLSRLGNTGVTFGFYGTDRRLSTELELSLYRIAQELVNNAIKYAGAGKINVQLFVEEKRVALQVTDNGSGFDLEEAERKGKGSGLKNIRNRVSAFNGRCEIFSRPGEGTEAMIEFEV